MPCKNDASCRLSKPFLHGVAEEILVGDGEFEFDLDFEGDFNEI